MRVLFAAAALLLLALMPATAQAEGYRTYAERLVGTLPAGARFRPDLEAYLNGLASSYRTSQGVAAFTSSKRATPAARAQAVEMVRGNFVGHQSAGGYRFRQRIEAFLGDGLLEIGENAARQQAGGAADKAKARRLFQQWVDSAGHRRNLVQRGYENVSSGVVQVGTHLYAVQLYWRQRQEPSSPFLSLQ